MNKSKKNAEKVDRTPDLMIFSHTLSQLSYLGFCWNLINYPLQTPCRTLTCEQKMRHCRTSKIDDVIDILRNEKSDFDPEPISIPAVGGDC